MRNFRLLFGLLFLPSFLWGADLRPVIMREAGKCAAAWQRNDYESVLTYLPPQVIQKSGGRAAALKKIKSQFHLAKEYGVERMDFSPGQPAVPKPVGRWLVALVPLTVVLHRMPLDVTQATHLLGLSSDQGKRWFFVPLYQIGQTKLNAWFPEFSGKVIVPDDPQPEVNVAF